MAIHAFLVDAASKQPILPEGLPDDAPCVTRLRNGGLEQTDVSLAHPNHRNSLVHQRWGLVVPKGPMGERLRARIAPLCAARATQQNADVVVYEVDPGMGYDATNDWLRQTYFDQVGRREEDLPRYMLILGGPELVSWEFQQMLGLLAFVGRLSFDTDVEPEGYEAYVAKVLQWERAPRPGLARAIFYTSRDGTAATECGYQQLVQPNIDVAAARKQRGLFPAEEIVTIGTGNARPTTAEQEAQAAQLLRTAEAAQASALFTMSHGFAAPTPQHSASDRRRLQGNLCMGGRGERLDGSLVRDKPFLAGGFWLMFACYGAGTPTVSAYASWLERLRSLGAYRASIAPLLAALPGPGEAPFVAALPQAALANPKGPLGVVGHVDLCWSWSFFDGVLGGARIVRPRHERFQGILRSVVEGGRIGAAFHELLQPTREIHTALLKSLETSLTRTELQDPREERLQQLKRTDLFMQANDLGAFVLLGDPAARLPISITPSDIELPTASSTPRTTPSPQINTPPTVARVTGGRDPHEMERAVHAHIRGHESAATIAERFRVTEDELLDWVTMYREAGRRALGQR